MVQKSKSKLSSKKKLPTTDELLKMYDDNSFLKNFKNKQLSDLIKDKTENDIQKNAMKIGNLIYSLIIKRIPIIIYTLIKIDNELNRNNLSILKNPVIKAIFANKGTKLQKINQLYNYIIFMIQEKPTVLFTIIKILDIQDIFNERKINVELSDVYTLANVAVFLFNMYKDEETIDDLISNYSRKPAENRSALLQNKINLLTTIRACIYDENMCEYKKVSSEINKESNQQSLVKRLFGGSNDSQENGDNIIEGDSDTSNLFK